MKVADFLTEVKSVYAKYFPNSKCVAEFNDRLYRSISISCYLANNTDECTNGYWINDMFKVRFSIDRGGREFPKDTTIDSEIFSDLTLECDTKHYTTKPTDKYCAYGSKQVSFRKTNGDAKKVLNTLDKFFSKLKSQLEEDLTNEVIHEHHKNLLLEKLGKEVSA